MNEQEDTRKKSRRDLLLILLILPFGVLCMFLTGQTAISLAPEWQLNVAMKSLLDPNATFVAQGIPALIEPVNPEILTQPAWRNLFLTPSASIPTRPFISSTPSPVSTAPPPIPTSIPQEKSTTTATAPGPIIIPTRDGPGEADLRIQISDNSRTYTPGTSIMYTILVTNSGPDAVPRFNIVDDIPAVITGLSINCTPASRCGTNTSSGNRVSFTGAALLNGEVITISVSGTVVSSATGDLVNTASVTIPSGVRVIDPDITNNTVTDRDTQFSVYDLAITKSNSAGVNTYEASQINYRIVVTNNGPSDAIGVTVADNRPAQIASWTWTCAAVVNAGRCTGGTSLSFRDTVDIRVGGRIEYQVSAVPAVPPASQNPQNISNTANINIPSDPTRFHDPDTSNNAATVTDIPYIDLEITKVDNGAPYLAGGSIPYIVTVTNNSTFDLFGIPVTDLLPTDITGWGWCVSPPCPPAINTDFTEEINLTAGSSLVYNVTANVATTVGLGGITNTASVSPPAGLTDADLTNNSSTVTTPPNIDLAISKTDGLDFYSPGGTLTYTIIVTNNSAIALNGVIVTDDIPTLIDPFSWTWNCGGSLSSPGTACSVPSGSGNLNVTVDLPASASIYLEASGTVLGSATGDLINTATVDPPNGILDVDIGNNTAQDTDGPQASLPPIYVNNDPPNDDISNSPASGETRTYNLTTPITIDGNTSDYEIVFFEWENDPGFIDMDQVIISISRNGTLWYVVYYWGDNQIDANASPPGQTSEPDNTPISMSLLYGSPFQTGILIDADGGKDNPPNGSYPFLSVTCPLGDADGGCDIDAIGIWP